MFRSKAAKPFKQARSGPESPARLGGGCDRVQVARLLDRIMNGDFISLWGETLPDPVAPLYMSLLYIEGLICRQGRCDNYCHMES